MTGDGVHAARLSAQGLSTRPGRCPAAVAERLLAIQGQDPRGARLAVRARSEGLAASDVDAAAAKQLAAPQKNPGSITVSPDDVAGEPGPSFWRRTWNLLSGKG